MDQMGHCMSYFSLQMFTQTFNGLLQPVTLRMSKHFADIVFSFCLTRSALVLTTVFQLGVCLFSRMIIKCTEAFSRSFVDIK